jgi:hypothetical protein
LERKKERLPGGGLKGGEQELEEFLFSWIIEHREQRFQVSYRRLISVARQTFKDTTLKFTYGWLQRFIDRYNLTYRRKTGNTFISHDSIEISFNIFFPELWKFRKNHEQKSIFCNMDETRVELDLLGGKTIDVKGVKYIPVETTNSDRKARTVALSAFDTGRKLPPLIIFDGVGTRVGPQLKTYSSVIAFSWHTNTSYINSKVFCKWWDDVSFSYTDPELRSKTIMLLDSCGNIHKSYSPEEIPVLFFPPNSTSKVQPMDIGVNKPFKDRLRLFWEER